MSDAINKLLNEIKLGKIKSKKKLEERKKEIAIEYKLNNFISNAEIFEKANGKIKEKIRKILQIKPTRTISGVAVVAVMAKPWPCPHGKCTYCPHINNVPESYTGKEPATRRAIANNFDPYKQVQNRLTQLYATGHIPQKVELIIMGGTFPAMPRGYQEDFVKKCLLAMNRFPKSLSLKKKTLEEIQKANEKAKIRCVGMTFETRPDWGKEKHAEFMLKLGGTRVELGVQTIYNDVYKKVNRGHTVEDVIESTKILKDKGFKVLYHMMLGLPGTTREMDINALKEIFKNPNFRPDMIKVYPTLVIRGSKLYEDWKRGKYKPIDEEYATDVIIEMKKNIPEWVRIMRIERDIPGTEIEAGIKSTNLRQKIQQKLKQEKIRCKCIRCREVGHVLKNGGRIDEKSIKLHKIEYEASGGKEFFLQFKDKNDVLIGFLRLRLSKTAIIRELHVYGEQILIGKHGVWQHKGYGRKLLKEAEKIAKENGYRKIYVISGIGAREYYRKFKYRKDGYYMSKRL